jgi:hypothetical protein
MATPTSEKPNGATIDGHSYKTGGQDRMGRTIKEVYAYGKDYVIYFTDHEYSKDHAGRELFYETDPPLKKGNSGKADTELAGINRLLDLNQNIRSREYKFNVSTLELAAGALKMFFRKEETEALEVLKGLHDKLQAKEEGQRRLMYQLGAIAVVALVWGVFLAIQYVTFIHGEWYAWILAGALAVAGGLFSVFLNINSLEVSINQSTWFLLAAGATRSIVAFLAGVGMLLAMRSKIFAGITYDSAHPAVLGAALSLVEMFFCFLAGFSEAFVPNILSKAAAGKSGKGAAGKGKAGHAKP